MIATGFVAAGPWDFVGHAELREGTVDKDKARLLDRDDMVANTFSTFQSLTVGCARCHDHKFDPIPQEEYYRLQAVFAGVDRADRASSNPEAAALAARKPEVEARRKALLKKADPTTNAKLDRASAELADIEARIKVLPAPEMVYAIVPHAPRPIHLLNRGLWPYRQAVEPWLERTGSRCLALP